MFELGDTDHMKVEITNINTDKQIGIYPIAIEVEEIFELAATNGGLLERVWRLVADAGLVNAENPDDYKFTLVDDSNDSYIGSFNVNRKVRDEVFDAHKHCYDNELEIMSSELCGCFGCLKIMKPAEVEFFEFRDKTNKNPRTACCPDCNIDTVIGSSSGYPITREFLKEMNNYFCGGRAE